MVNQQPIGRTPRSNPVTYTGIFSNIRTFSTACRCEGPGYRPGRFSFNVKGGRCESCRATSHQDRNALFTGCLCNLRCLPGKRFNPDTLEIATRTGTCRVLDMTVHQALDFFGNIPAIRRISNFWPTWAWAISSWGSRRPPCPEGGSADQAFEGTG